MNWRAPLTAFANAASLVLPALPRGDANHFTRWDPTPETASDFTTFFNYRALHNGIGLNLARAFVNGNQLGVVVWNLNTQAKREFTVQVPGYRLAKASAPGEEAVPALSPLEPNSVRLLVFER